MLCERAQELFSEYHEGAVQGAMLVPLESHLDECENCRADLMGMREVWQILDSAPIVEPPVGFRAAVWARIDAAEAEKARVKKPVFAFDWRSIFRPATMGWAAAALALLLLAPVVIPGARSVAGLWFPWSLLYGSHEAQITLSQPRVTMKDGQKWVDLQVKNTGRSATRVEIQVSGSAAAPVTIDAPAGSSEWYHIAPATSSTSELKATWQENGTSSSESLTIPQ